MVAIQDVEMASEKQRRYLGELLTRKAAQPSLVRQIEAQLELGISKRQASIFIDGLLRLADRPAPAPARPAAPAGGAAPVRGDRWPGVAEGRYAIEDPADGVLKFYQVGKPQEGRWAGFTFLDVFASEQRWPVKQLETKARILDAIARQPQAALQRYGQELGICGVCGKELTDATSRAFGIGPVCRGKRGYNVRPAEELGALDADPYLA